MILQRYSRKPLSGWETEERMLGNGMGVLPESQPLERQSERTLLLWHLLGWITSIKLGLECTWRVWKQEMWQRKSWMLHQLHWSWIQRERKRFIGVCDCLCLSIICLILWSCKTNMWMMNPQTDNNFDFHGCLCAGLFLLHIRCQSGQMFSFLCDQCGMLMASHCNQRHSDFLSASESKSSHTAKIWSGLSKCRNITGIPEEMCSGPQFNQERAAELAQICDHKNVFLA